MCGIDVERNDVSILKKNLYCMILCVCCISMRNKVYINALINASVWQVCMLQVAISER